MIGIGSCIALMEGFTGYGAPDLIEFLKANIIGNCVNIYFKPYGDP